MILGLFRVLAGFAAACLMAGLITVAFVITPAELSALSGDALSRRITTFGELTLIAATHSAIFAAPFALIAAVVGEWQGLRGPMVYLLAGTLIALGGFFAQYSSETGAAASIANNYALKAYLSAGFFAGLAYWLVAGRSAGDEAIEPPRRNDPKPTVSTTVPTVARSDAPAAVKTPPAAKPAAPPSPQPKGA